MNKCNKTEKESQIQSTKLITRRERDGERDKIGERNEEGGTNCYL